MTSLIHAPRSANAIKLHNTCPDLPRRPFQYISLVILVKACKTGYKYSACSAKHPKFFNYIYKIGCNCLSESYSSCRVLLERLA